MTIKIIKTNEYNKLFPAIREYYNNIIIILGLYEWYKRNKYNKNMNKPNINNENNIIWRLLRRNY